MKMVATPEAFWKLLCRDAVLEAGFVEAEVDDRAKANIVEKVMQFVASPAAS